MESFLTPLLDPLSADGITFRIHNLRGKERLLHNLPIRLRGYRNWPAECLRIVVLVDRDEDDCRALKTRLEAMAESAGLVTRSQNPVSFQVLNRIVVQELESWLLGDPEALRAAYPRLPETFEATEPFRDPDAVPGGAYEGLERLLASAYRQPDGWAKGQIAANVARHFVPKRNRSRSFHAFWSGLGELLTMADTAPGNRPPS